MNNQSPQKTVQEIFNDASRIVIKIGSDLLVDKATLEPRTDWLNTLVADIKELQNQDKEIILVASGAVALGRKDAGYSACQELEVPDKQKAATWGISHHTRIMQEAFDNAGVKSAAGQLVQPHHLLDDRKDQNNTRRNLDHVLSHQGVPVLNENDSVATEELKFGNNDVLAAQLADLMNADLTIILSDLDGFYDKDPKKHDDIEHIPYITEITQDIKNMATEDTNASSTGGMKSKIEAVEIAWNRNITVIIGKGCIDNPIEKLLDASEKCTCFVPQSLNKELGLS